MTDHFPKSMIEVNYGKEKDVIKEIIEYLVIHTNGDIDVILLGNSIYCFKIIKNALFSLKRFTKL